MRVLHAPVNFGSHPSTLAEAENRFRGLVGGSGESRAADFQPSGLVSSAADVFPMAGRGIPAQAASRLRGLAYALRRVPGLDVLHLYFGLGFLRLGWRAPWWNGLEIGFWRCLGPRVFMTFQGCEVRHKTACARQAVSACRTGECSVAWCDAGVDRARSAMVRALQGRCDKLFCLNPDLLPFVPGAEFLPYANVDPDLLRRPPGTPPTGGIPVIAHAPSDRSIKGTRYVVEAVAGLGADRARLDLVEGVPRAEALERYATATLLVDQVLIGWYGGLAVEAMALGLPVVCYLNPTYLAAIPTPMRDELPLVSATPGTLAETLAGLLADPGRRAELARLGRRFVARWHHPVRIARRMFDLYRDPSLSFWAGYDPEAPVGPPG